MTSVTKKLLPVSASSHSLKQRTTLEIISDDEYETDNEDTSYLIQVTPTAIFVELSQLKILVFGYIRIMFELPATETEAGSKTPATIIHSETSDMLIMCCSLKRFPIAIIDTCAAYLQPSLPIRTVLFKDISVSHYDSMNCQENTWSDFGDSRRTSLSLSKDVHRTPVTMNISVNEVQNVKPVKSQKT